MKVRNFFVGLFMVIGVLCLICLVVTADNSTHAGWKIWVWSTAGGIVSFVIAMIIDDPHRLYRRVAATTIVVAAVFYRVFRHPFEFGKRAYILKRRSGTYHELYADMLDRYDSKQIQDQIHYLSKHSEGGRR